MTLCFLELQGSWHCKEGWGHGSENHQICRVVIKSSFTSMGEQHTVKDFPPLSANLVPCTPLTADCFTLPPGHASQWVREVASSSQPLALVPILLGQCSWFPDQGCGRDALQQDWKEAAVPFPIHAKIFFGLSGNSNTKKVCFLALNKAQEHLFLLDNFLPKMKQNKHFPLFGTPDVWAVKAVTLIEEPSAGIADCEFQVHQWIGQRCAKIQRVKKYI